MPPVVFADAHDVAQAPAENLAACGVGHTGGGDGFDGEGLYHATAGGLLGRAGVDVGVGADGDEEGVWAEL